jgi:hypothetical protein
MANGEPEAVRLARIEEQTKSIWNVVGDIKEGVGGIRDQVDHLSAKLTVHETETKALRSWVQQHEWLIRVLLALLLGGGGLAVWQGPGLLRALLGAG